MKNSQIQQFLSMALWAKIAIILCFGLILIGIVFLATDNKNENANLSINQPNQNIFNQLPPVKEELKPSESQVLEDDNKPLEVPVEAEPVPETPQPTVEPPVVTTPETPSQPPLEVEEEIVEEEIEEAEPIPIEIEEGEETEEELDPEVVALETTINSEIVEIANSLGLTQLGKKIFYKTRPEIVERQTIELLCPSPQGGYVAGCFYPNHNKLYVLKGVDNIETIFIHEIMHAIWLDHELGSKADFHHLLQEVYLAHIHILGEALEAYQDIDGFSNLDRFNELHSFIATSIENLPDELETHYSSILTNRKQFIRPPAVYYPINDQTIANECSYDLDNNQINCLERRHMIGCKNAGDEASQVYQCLVNDRVNDRIVAQWLCDSKLTIKQTEFKCTLNNTQVRDCQMKYNDQQILKIICSNPLSALDQISCLTNALSNQNKTITCYNLLNSNKLVVCAETTPEKLTCRMPQDTPWTNSFASITTWKFINLIQTSNQ